MKEFNRKYFCQDDHDDVLEVSPLDTDKVRLVCTSNNLVSSVHLNATQVANLIKLLSAWRGEVPSDELWEDT